MTAASDAKFADTRTIAPHMTVAIWTGLGWVFGAVAFLFLARAGFGGHALAIRPGDVALAALFASSMILAAPLAWSLGGDAKRSTVAGVLAPWMLVFFSIWFAPSQPVLLAGLVAAAAAGLFVVLRSGTLGAGSILAVVSAGGIFAWAHGLILATAGHPQPLALEAALVGAQHRDTLFHAAIASSLREVGFASIGLDGFRPMAYHVLSHRIVAALSEWAGTSPLNIYSLFTLIVGVPFLVFSLLWTAAAVILSPRKEQSAPLMGLGLVGWLFFSAASGISSFWFSESYIVSLWAFLGSVAIMHAAAGQSVRDGWTACLLLALMVTLAGLSKVSTGAVMACGIAAFFAIRGRFGPEALVMALLSGPVPFAAVYLATAPGGAGESIFGALDLFAEYPKAAAFHVAFVAVMLWLLFRHRPEAEGPRALTLALATMMLAALASSMLLALPAGAALYFANPAIWAGLCLIPLLGLVPRGFRNASGRVQTFLVVAGLALVIVAERDMRVGPERLLEIRERVATGSGDDVVSGSPLGPIVLAASRADGVYVASGPSAFWTISEVCWSTALAIPAISGTPLLAGIPDETSGCEPTSHYGYVDYAVAPGSAPTSDEEICAAASTRGMHDLIIVGSALELRELACPSDG